MHSTDLRTAMNTALTNWAGPGAVYPRSWTDAGDLVHAIVRGPQGKRLAVGSRDAAALPSALEGVPLPGAGVALRVCPLSHETAVALRELVPWTAPVSLRRQRTTIGCGDRLGCATPGHLRAARAFDVSPVLAQQSIRELTLTNRTFEDVVDDVTFLVLQEGYSTGYGADGDHLKTLADIDMAIDAGMAMITLDLTEKMNPAAEGWDAAEINRRFAQLPANLQSRVDGTYGDRTFEVEGATVHVSQLEARRCALMYLAAMDFSREAYDLLRSRRGDAFDLEISIDETEAPTLPAHHLFIIRELLYRDIQISSLAPRFIGEFQKAIDYIGDLAEFERQFQLHCAISRAYGAYKVSIHSGSDKFSAYPVIGRHTDFRVHVKTAGTSWLEALRAVADADPALFRRLHAKALGSLAEARKLYHITPDLRRVPAPDALPDDELSGLLDRNDPRQVLHITYAGTLNDPELAPAFFACLDRNEEVYYDHLERHFRRHLTCLGLEG